MKLFNSMTRQKEEFVPITPGEVKIYSCGPTVYNFFHIGNARPFIVFDVLRRYFEYSGYNVKFVQNFTDVDDKVINKANEEGVSFEEIANRYIKEYFTDAKGLGIREATVHPKATENIDAIIEIVQTLVDKGYAYAVDGDVYYRARKFEGYGKLSKQPLEELEAGARIGVDERKEDPMDFALWKSAKPGEPYWESPWGNGRPGWHIECSAMANRYLGKSIDIHSGGVDLTFPHHENEIAQSEAANGCTFANYWLHNAFLNIDNHKMSKSAGNFFTVRDAAAVYGYEPIRFFMLAAHYRSPLNYSRESLEQASAALERMYTAKDRIKFLMENGADGNLTERETAALSELDAFEAKFRAAMDDDLNTADAISVIFEMIRLVNSELDGAPTRAFASRAAEKLFALTDVLGLIQSEEDDTLTAEVEELIAARQAARKEKNFAEADRIRDLLKEKGIILEDTPQGVKWKKA
ncbi:MAG: cysteine--tRNA ligase [Ruminococcaceae bacterium]|nr:cysteine--tRNA ligase [Oscillospiraceae bacterium]